MDDNVVSWQDALEVVVARTKHERYRVLCSGSWPDHESYRQLMIEQATGALAPISEFPPGLEYPSVFQQFMNVAGAVGSAVSAAVQGEPISVSPEEQDDRLAICHACLPPDGFWDVKQERCSKCGCFGDWKTWLATQHCPIDKW
jgi:hypothetical protein